MVAYRTNDQGIARLSDVQVQSSGTTFTATFAGASQNSNYLVTTAGAAYSPVLVTAPQKVDLNQPAQYLIISHPDFIGGMQPFVDAKLAQGLSVSVVDVNDIYAQYSDGIFDPQAIKQYIAFAAQNLGTEYVLLVGGNSFDYRNRLGLDSISYIPSLYEAIGSINFVPVDPLYADVNS